MKQKLSLSFGCKTNKKGGAYMYVSILPMVFSLLLLLRQIPRDESFVIISFGCTQHTLINNRSHHLLSAREIFLDSLKKVKVTWCRVW